MSLNLFEQQCIPMIQLLILQTYREVKWLAQVHMSSHKAEHHSRAVTCLQSKAGSIKPGFPDTFHLFIVYVKL